MTTARDCEDGVAAGRSAELAVREAACGGVIRGQIRAQLVPRLGATAFGEAGAGHVKQVTTWHSNIGGKHAGEHNAAYRARFPDVSDDLYYSAIRESINALALAIEKAKSTDPGKVAAALENLVFEDDSGEVYMRADNHQLVQPLYISTLVKANGKNARFDVEKTGLGFRTDARIEGKDTVMPTTCKFQRP